MKTLILILGLIYVGAIDCLAQHFSNEEQSVDKKLYVGVAATTMGYNLKYKKEPKGGDIYTYGVLNLGYKLGKRARLQVGLSYGSAEIDHSYVYVESEGNHIYHEEVARTHGVAVPITVEYILFYPFRKLQFYGTSMLTPIYSTTRLEKTKQQNGVASIDYNEKASGFNTYLTAGFGIGYPISKRLDGYFNYYVISRNFNNGLRKKDEYPYPGSLMLGVNFKIK